MKVLANTQRNMLPHEQKNYLPANDHEYFSGIYDRYAARIYGLIIKWIKEKEMAEILLQGTFEKAWHNRKLFNAGKDDLFCRLCKMAGICYYEYIATAPDPKALSK